MLRQHHRPGEKAFVDFCDGIALTDPVNGLKVPTHLFVGALGASSYTFAVATLSQALPAWLDCHVRMYAFYHGVSALTIPDNLRAAVSKADRYEAELNPSYRELAEHYGTCVIPARVRKPRDKAKAEAAVLVAQRWILAVLRHRTFYSLAELNGAIAELLVTLNDRVMRHVNASRRSLYERLDRPALKLLPATPYEYADWKQVKVNIDYHVSFDDHLYSVPYTLVGETLWCRATHRTVELLHKGKRIASHPRSFAQVRVQHDPRAPPGVAPGAPAMDTLAADPVGPHHRAAHGGARRARDPQQAAPRARLSLHARHPAPGEDTRRRAARAGLRQGAADQLRELQDRQDHARATHGGSAAARRRRRARRQLRAPRWRQCARARLLPLKSHSTPPEILHARPLSTTPLTGPTHTYPSGEPRT